MWRRSAAALASSGRYHIKGFVKIYAKDRSPADWVEPSTALPGILANGPLVETVSRGKTQRGADDPHSMIDSSQGVVQVLVGEVGGLRNAVKGSQIESRP